MILNKTLNNTQTQLNIWDNPFDCEGVDVVVCVTGNPGIPDFYNEFAAELNRRTGFPICVVGQAGHVKVQDDYSNDLENNPHLFNLEGQLEHKLDLINRHIDKKSRLHLIGHSIGAWMIIELLMRNNEVANRTASLNLLFPTIQKLGETRNGKIINRVLRPISYLVTLLFVLVNLLPQTVRSFLVQLYLKFNSLPMHYEDRVLKYLHPKVGEKVLYLAFDEMDTVKALNVEGIEKVKHMTNVIYSTSDDWAPVKYIDELRRFQPPLTMKEVDVDHAFVLKSSERVAGMVQEFIKTKI